MKNTRLPRSSSSLIALTLLILVLVLIFLPRSKKFVLLDGTRVTILAPKPFATLHDSIYHVSTWTQDGHTGEMTLHGDFERNPILTFSVANDDHAFYILYDCDVMLRLLKIDTKQSFHGSVDLLASNGIVASSSLYVEEGSKSDWLGALNCLEHMTATEFQKNSMPTLDVGILRMYARQDLVVSHIRRQVSGMYGGKSSVYGIRK